MALTKVTGHVVKTDTNVHTHNINSSGIVTAIGLDVNGNADISGNLGVGGTLTYQDVTSIDAVGIITAQSGLHLGIGATAGKIDITTGISTFTNIGIGDSINHLGNTDTSIRFPSDDNISMEIAGTERFDLTSTTLSIHGNIRASDYVAHRTVDSLGVKFYNAGAGNNNTHVGLGAEDNGTSGGINHKTFQVFRQGSSVNRVNIDASGNLNVVTGKLQINDTIEHIGDSNTKIRFPAADTVTVETAGTERLRIESNGDVEWNNVGTPTPGEGNNTVGMGFEPRNGTIFLSRGSNVLIISNRNNDGRHIHFNQGGTGKFAIGLQNSGADLAFFSGAGNSPTERLRIDSSGRVLIGTTTVGSTTADDLTVATSGDTGITVRSGTSNSGNLFFSDGTSGNSNFRGYVQYLHSSNALLFGTNAGERARITSAGNVGIGSAVPTGKLDIAPGGNSFIKFGQDSDNPKMEMFRSTGGSPSHYGAELQFLTGDFAFSNAPGANLGSHSYTERFRITSAGSVGIGTNNPNVGNSAYPVCQVHGTSLNSYFKLTNTTTGVGSNDGVELSLSGSDAYLTNRESASIIFRTAATERLRITSDGKIGINNSSPGGAPGSIDQTNSRSTAFSATTDQRALAGIIIRQVSDASGRFASLSFVNGGGTQAEASINLVQQGNYVGDLVIKHRTGGSSWRESLRIMDDGTIRQNGATWTNNAIRAVLYNPDSTGSQMQFQHTGTTTGTSRGFRVGHNGSGGQLWNFENDYIRFATNNNERVRITAAGYMGINTTNPVRPLHIVGNDGSSGATSGNSDTTLVLENAGSNGSMIEFMNANSGAGHLMFTDSDASNRGRISYHHSGDYFRIDTGGVERMRITSAGKLLVGRTSSITVASDPSDHNFEQLTNNGGAVALHCNKQYKRGLMIYYPSDSGASDAIRFQINNAAKFLVIGSGNCQNANNSYGSISDASLKENIVDAKSQWNDIKNIKIRNFNFKESSGHQTHTQIGVVAQELETVCPKLIDNSGKDGIKTVASTVLYMKAVKALQEAMTRIESLEAEVAALKSS